jgi:hypothetical protein
MAAGRLTTLTLDARRRNERDGPQAGPSARCGDLLGRAFRSACSCHHFSNARRGAILRCRTKRTIVMLGLCRSSPVLALQDSCRQEAKGQRSQAHSLDRDLRSLRTGGRNLSSPSHGHPASAGGLTSQAGDSCHAHEAPCGSYRTRADQEAQTQEAIRAARDAPEVSANSKGQLDARPESSIVLFRACMTL